MAELVIYYNVGRDFCYEAMYDHDEIQTKIGEKMHLGNHRHSIPDKMIAFTLNTGSLA